MSEKLSLMLKSRRHGTDIAVTGGLVAVVLFFAISGAISYMNIRTVSDNAVQVNHTHDVLTSLDGLMLLMKDAETGQRGYIITGEDSYLEPYYASVNLIEVQLARIESLTKDNPDHVKQIPPLKAHAKARLAELNKNLNLFRNGGFETARASIATNRGKGEMDALRNLMQDMRQAEYMVRTEHMREKEQAYRVSIISGVLTGAFGVGLSLIVAWLVRRAADMRRRQEWMQSGQVGLGLAMNGDQRVEQLGESVLKFLAEYFDAHAGAFYAKDGEGFRRAATYGVPADGNVPEEFKIGDGLLGQAAKEGRTFFVRDVPDGYLTLGSALGQGNPRHLVIAPAMSDGGVNAVLELGFVHGVTAHMTELLDKVSESISVALRSANYRANLQDFLEETQRQAEELQAQSEELRVSNEELEEQGRALRESQSRLEQQQAELEQTNAQLEEQSQLLEIQKDDLSRTKEAVEIKALELEQASQYKSDFLANMSHELRTPLNSSLILAKLLADNPEGRLSDEQVKYAQTIQSSGNDLLALINDILDLSKIEAGHMEVRPESVPLTRLASGLEHIFQPIAQQRGLTFKTSIAPGAPETIDTDRQRLEQILKNLLSNAFKFTEKGGVELLISAPAKGRLSFAVIDTGIGIPEEKQKTIFDAFRQADSTISRKYGGTGLGLSISRELSRLLGGAITLESAEGKGSTFTLDLAETYEPSLLAPRVHHAEESVFAENSTPATEKMVETPPRKLRWVEDDREKLKAGVRTILVIEDDEPFARILHDLAHELGFQCLIAMTAEDALTMVRQYKPSAVVLDVGLPDHSGLTVLDRLKRDSRTRHIPVHVVSASDYAQKALSLGAVGYMLKPVPKDDLVTALKGMEMRLNHRLRRVLIVEDDKVQRDSVMKLLGGLDVETVGTGTAAECLEKLKESTFDCMVLDLSLPDASGYSLLETLSHEDAYSFPPVIVYTGRDLSSGDEQKLRRYSKSIIIKGAKSPERLLDEVTLFLHQVVSDLPSEKQRMIEKARNRDAVLENRRILVVEDDVRNVYALTNILEPQGAKVEIARNGREALEILEKNDKLPGRAIDLVLMDVMMPEMDGLTATREIRKRSEWKKMPVIMLTAKAMRDDQERCLQAGANDYMAKPLDVEKLLSLVRVWMPR